MKSVHTRILMLSSAVFMAALGLTATFAPEILVGAKTASTMSLLAAQTAGALYLGFAMLNWMAKDNAIGGIYSRPVAMGNLLHFFATAMALLRLTATGKGNGFTLIVTVFYVTFAACFGLVVFGKSPTSATKPS